MANGPAGAYEAQVLLLAPETGEDDYTLSLLAQFLEMGIAIELDENWRLPKTPPKDLSAYRACLLPESAREKYDGDLEAYLRGGGFVPYFRYYPERAKNLPHRGVHHYLESFGRDAYMFHAANVTIEAGVDLYEPNFAQVMMNRDESGMIDEYRSRYINDYRNASGPATSWGDPQYTQTVANFILNQRLDDPEWRGVVTRQLERFAEAVDVVMADHVRYQEIKNNDVVQCNAIMIGGLLMEWGDRIGRQDIVRAGVKISRFWLSHTKQAHGTVVEGYFRLMWSEAMISLPALVGLARYDGDAQCATWAENLVMFLADRNQSEDGLWHHWTDETGKAGSKWSRGTLWPTLWMTQALSMSASHDTPLATRCIERLQLTFEGLRQSADAETGAWRLVIDDPTTRIESSASAGLVFCHDRLRAMGVFDDTLDGMADRARRGLKRLWYDAGMAANCRGTSTGTGDYYRTRPMGYYRLSLMPATLMHQ